MANNIVLSGIGIANSGASTAGQLTVTGTGIVNLSGANNITTLVNSTSGGAFSLTNTGGDIALGDMDTMNGSTTPGGGDIIVNAAGRNITGSGNLNAVNHNLTLYWGEHQQLRCVDSGSVNGDWYWGG